MYIWRHITNSIPNSKNKYIHKGTEIPWVGSFPYYTNWRSQIFWLYIINNV